MAMQTWENPLMPPRNFSHENPPRRGRYVPLKIEDGGGGEEIPIPAEAVEMTITPDQLPPGTWIPTLETEGAEWTPELAAQAQEMLGEDAVLPQADPQAILYQGQASTDKPVAEEAAAEEEPAPEMPEPPSQ